MPRLLFEKKGAAVWISHLDLMRLFQRAFKRANLPLMHTKGFNPRPSVSIALPLSVGIASSCELLDFDLEGEEVPCEEIQRRLNENLVEGVKVLDVYREGRKINGLSFLRCSLDFLYDGGIPEGASEQLRQLFSGTELTVEKKNKNGVSQQDIIPMIREMNISAAEDNTLRIHAVVCCQNPSLNPMQLHAAVIKYLPRYVPNHVLCSRMEVYDQAMNVFR